MANRNIWSIYSSQMFSKLESFIDVYLEESQVIKYT